MPHTNPLSRRLPFTLMAGVALLVLVAGCRGRRTPMLASADVHCPPGGAIVMEAPGMQAMPDGTFAQEGAMPAMPEEDRLGEDLRMRMAVERDKVRFLVQQKLEAARQHIHNGEYAQAESLLREAEALDPSSREVRAELRDVQALLGRREGRAGGMIDEMRALQQVRVDEQRTTVSRYVNLGRMHLANRRFDSAIESFEQALFIIEASPLDIDWRGLREEAQAGLRDARRTREEAERSQRRAATERTLAELAREEEQQLLAEMQRLERLMGAAVEAFHRNDFSQAGFYADQVLAVQPDNTKAQDLARSARRAQHDVLEVEYLRAEKLAFRQWMADIQATRVPQLKILKWPSQTFWDRISAARAQARPSFGEIEIDPEAAALRTRVRNTTVNIAIEEQTLRETVRQLQVQTGINIHIDPRIESEVGENPVTSLYLTDVSLEVVLEQLRMAAGEDVVWTARANVVVFTNRSLVRTQLVTQIHNVADLTAGLTDFIAGTLRIVDPDMVSDEESPLFGAEGEEPRLPYGTADELVDLIRQVVESEFWANTEGAEVRSANDQAILVKSTPEVQERVARFLNDLRGFSGIVVTVETRFLEVGDHFLRDVGVDFRGLGGQTPGTLVNLDDVTNGLEDMASAGFDNGGGGLTTGAALNPSSGVYFNDGQDGDFRARTENIFDRSLGNVLSALGGASLTLTYLEDTQIAMIVRAVEKNAKVRTLTAPTITVYNTQRANLTVVNQLSYIQDFDVEVAQTSFIADPIVGIIQDGLTLDVRPTVSHDRRYITLELQPTVADLIEPIPTFATSLASTFAPVIIQLPELRIQQARMTVRIPDRGSILIGGLKNIRTVDRQSETPLLAKIPLLSFLFSRKGRSNEISTLMILVRAEISDLQEQEAQFMAGAAGFTGPFAPPPSPFHLETPLDPCLPRPPAVVR